MLYLNGERLSEFNISENEQLGRDSLAKASSDWVKMSSSTSKVSWKKGVTTAVVAGAIAVGLGFLGASQIINCIGLSALAVIAAAAIGGTLYVSLWKIDGFGWIQYRYDWYFVASTGQRLPSTGKYYYHP